MKKYVVYKITNKINGKIYIGMTNDVKRRWRYGGIEYRPPLKSDRHRPFWNAIQKYGWDNFTKEIMISGLTKEDAFEKEIQMIKEFDSTNKKIGYNLSPGGNGGIVYKVHPRGMLGKTHTLENKNKHRLFMSDKRNNPMYNGKTIWGVTHPHPKGMKGKKHSEEKRRQISETLKRKGPNRKKVKAKLPNGEIVIYDSLNSCCKELGLCTTSPMTIKLLKTNQPYKMRGNIAKKYHERLKKLEGLTLKYLDNTEVTNDSKIS
ncbi:GIY-YIG nuclease family protein [Mammaliicoccus sciuri]|uniref:GIY-YIG nuclease family protein n=1 Tax=Mammaliicoccus sciuri TaxID=1296 RepID=UPI002DB6CFB3|nr:GIY-YIG nuclease family protein [Mammaliicoccus sciuri]MEB5649006.1 GIY-YIG nuclease family protein [Mammaliicoccus sciuri]